MESLAKKSLLWFSVALLLFVLISAVRAGIVELISLNATHRMDEWSSIIAPLTVKDVESVSSQFELARFLAEDDPAHHENLARLSLVHAALSGILPDEKKSLLHAGLIEIRTAIRQRPISPFSWTILLTIKRDLGEFDAEFRHALHRAADLGPWEPQVLIGLADVGLSSWTAMPAEEQVFIQQIFIRGREKQKFIMGGQGEDHIDVCAEQILGCQ